MQGRRFIGRPAGVVWPCGILHSVAGFGIDFGTGIGRSIEMGGSWSGVAAGK